MKTQLTLFLSLSALCVPLATAQAAEPGMAGTDVERAQTYVDLGTRLYKQKKFAEALQEFERAETIVTVAETRAVLRYNIARCHEELGRPVAAWFAFKRYLELPDSPEAQSKALARISALEAAHVGRLRIRVEPAGAACVVAPLRPEVGVPERLPCPADTQPWPRGAWRVQGSLEAPPRRSERQVDVAAGAEARLNIALPAWLVVRVDAPGTEVRVNGQSIGAPTPDGTEVMAGPTRVELVRGEQVLWRSERALAAGEVVTLEVPAGVVPSAQRAAPERGALPWILAGGAVAAFAGAGATYAQSLAAAEDGDAAAREMTAAKTREAFDAARARVRSADDDAALNYSIALGCAAAGAALGGVAAWLFLTDPAPAAGSNEASP